MKPKMKKLVKNYVVIILASIIYAIAFDWLFDPNHISMGGLTGIAQIINHYVPALPPGTMVVILNIPLFILGVRARGFQLLWSSLFAMVVSSVMMDVLPLFITFQPMEDQMVACIFGGALLGLSMGMMLFVGATTGGTELAASHLKRKLVHVQIGRICLILDVLVTILYAAAFRDINMALYAGIALFISSAAMDAVIYGRRSSKVAFIITDRGKEMMDHMLAQNLGITQIKARGAFSQDEKTVLLCAFKPSSISWIKSAVIEKDPDAFVIICDAKDVFGEGFGECDLNGL